MGIFDFLKQPDINKGVEEFKATAGAVLVDVRTPEEYRSGHIPGSCNIPLQQLELVSAVAEKKDTALYVHCHSGARSRQAAAFLQSMGYTNVHNIGGITAYRGKMEK